MKTTKDQILQELAEAKGKLPKQYMSLLIHFFPEVEQDEALQTKIRNIMQGRGFDELWVKRIIHVAEHYKQPAAYNSLDMEGMVQRLKEVVKEHVQPFSASA